VPDELTKKRIGGLSEKHAEARGTLPDELLGAFDALVADYKFYSSIYYGARLVSYRILADLVRSGWRPPPDKSEPKGE
jgi:hypothetical protein